MASTTQCLQSALKKVGQLIYPNVCLQCEAIGDSGIDLCERCLIGLPWIEYACQQCALPLPSMDMRLCGPCSSREYYFDQAYAPFKFEGFIRDAIYQFKFNQKLNYGKLLARLLSNHIKKQQLQIPDVIIPVPLHKKRLRKRGYNQALEITRILGNELRCNYSYHDIYRNRDTTVQMDLPAKQRYKNVKDAFSLKENSTFNNKHICIVDDVMTTGNTVNEMAKCLTEAKAAKIDVWCIARVD